MMLTAYLATVSQQPQLLHTVPGEIPQGSFGQQQVLVHLAHHGEGQVLHTEPQRRVFGGERLAGGETQHSKVGLAQGHRLLSQNALHTRAARRVPMQRYRRPHTPKGVASKDGKVI